MHAHRIAASFSIDTIVLKNGSVVFAKKNEIFVKSSKISQRVAKKQNPYIFITPVVFKQNLTLAKKTSTIYYETTYALMRLNMMKLKYIKSASNEHFYFRLRLEKKLLVTLRFACVINRQTLNMPAF